MCILHSKTCEGRIKIKKDKKLEKFAERTDIAKLINNNFNWVLDAKIHLADIDVEGGDLVWKGGTWIDGNWEGGVWERGEWHKGNWENGTWEFGTWENGIWENGVWKNGTWKDGIWETGKWKGGKWIKGYIKTKYGNIKSTKNPKEYNKYINKNPKATKEDLEKYLR